MTSPLRSSRNRNSFSMSSLWIGSLFSAKLSARWPRRIVSVCVVRYQDGADAGTLTAFIGSWEVYSIEKNRTSPVATTSYDLIA